MKKIHSIFCFPGQAIVLIAIAIYYFTFPKQFYKLTNRTDGELDNEKITSLAKKTYQFTVTISVLVWIWCIKKVLN